MAPRSHPEWAFHWENEMTIYKITITTDNECVKDDILEVLQEGEEECQIAGPFNTQVDEVPE
jgi:hypothetical protein